MEEASGRHLARFFGQWLYRGGVPRVEGGWRHTGSALEIELRQTQDGEPFELEIPVVLELEAGSATRIEKMRMTERETRLSIPIEGTPRAVALDPQLWVLMEPAFVRK